MCVQRFLAVVTLLLSVESLGQSSVEYLTGLDVAVEESSGLLLLDGKLITHNDSGSDAYLYEIDTMDGSITRTVYVEGVSSTDWEDITKDDSYIYVGDIGNNSGDRIDLAIFRISISDYQTTPNDTVTAEAIFYSYEDQTDFTPASFNTDYDAEALIAYGDSLYIFSKNWVNFKTRIYSVSKSPGTVEAKLIDSIDVEGLITGADYDPIENEILLSGHTEAAAFVYVIRNIISSNFATADGWRIEPDYLESIQTEGISSNGAGCYFVSSEKNFLTGDASLHKLCIADNLGVDSPVRNTPLFYPNPAGDKVQLNTESAVIEICGLDGKLWITSKNKSIDVRALPSGVYVLLVRNSKGEVFGRERLVVE